MDFAARSGSDLVLGAERLKESALSTRLHRASEDLAMELARRWKAAFEFRSWPQRLELLHQIHEQLREDLHDFEMYCAVSPLLVRELIDYLSSGPIESLAQAQVYANSIDLEHRRAAKEWFTRSTDHEQAE